MIKADNFLINPEFDFFVTRLFFCGHFENVNVDFATAIKVVNDCVHELGKRASANVAFDILLIFVHEKEGVGLIDVFVKTLVDISETFGVVGIAGVEPATKR